MLYLYYGSDESKIREKVRAVLAGLMKRAPHAHVERFTSEDAERFEVPSLLQSQGLFYTKQIVVLDHVYAIKEMREQIAGNLEDLAASEHVFLLLEGSLLPAQQKKLIQHAQKVERHDVSGEVSAKMNVFELSDLFGRRDRKALWVSYRTFLAYGSSPEELHGILFWALKCMVLADGASSAEEAGLKPFVFNKSKRYAAQFKKGELGDMVAALAVLPQEAHNRGVELEYALERFILEQ